MILGLGIEAELGEDLADVALDGLQLERQRLGDPLVRSPLGHEAEDLALTPSQLIDGRVPPRPSEQPCDHLRVDHRAAARHASDGIRQVIDRLDGSGKAVREAGDVTLEVLNVTNRTIADGREVARALVARPASSRPDAIVGTGW